jgi:hypothetical protein
MTFKSGRLLPIDDREPRLDAGMLNPSMAQHHLWLAQVQFDYSNLSSRELGKFEGMLSMPARRSRTLFNPFTGEIRRMDSNDEIMRPSIVFLGGCGGIKEF